MVRMLLLMAGIAAVLADPTPPVDVQPAAEAPADEDVVARATFTMSSNGESSEKVCTLRRGQDAAAAAVSFAEAHPVTAEGLLHIAQHMAGLSVDGYEPPKELRLRTAGAHKKKPNPNPNPNPSPSPSPNPNPNPKPKPKPNPNPNKARTRRRRRR